MVNQWIPVQIVQLEMGHVVEIANGMKHIRNVYQKVFAMQMFTGLYGVPRGVCRFSLQYLWKRAVRITEKTLYSSKGKIVYVVGKP